MKGDPLKRTNVISRMVKSYGCRSQYNILINPKIIKNNREVYE